VRRPAAWHLPCQTGSVDFKVIGTSEPRESEGDGRGAHGVKRATCRVKEWRLLQSVGLAPKAAQA
jgi:hypothetical protein